MILSKIALTTVLFCFVTFALQRFKLYTFESDHLFLFDADWILQNLIAPGGINLIITSFLTQFFKFPILGTIVVAIFYAAAFICLKLLISNSIWKEKQNGLLLIPIGFLMLCVEEPLYSLRGHTAFIICLIVSVLYQQFICRRQKFSLAATVLCAILLYLATGSVALLFAAIVLTTNILQKRKPINGLAAIATVFACGFVFYLTESYVSFAEAILPMQYYNWPTSGLIATCAWLSVPTVIAASNFIHNQRFDHIAHILTIVAFGFALNQIHDKKTYKLQHESYLADNCLWDKIIRLNSHNNVKTNFISYTNLALAMQGQLLDRMFEFNQQLPTQQNNSRTVRNETFHLESLAYFLSGHAAEARQAAFNSTLITPGGVEPHDFLRLIAINKSFGANDVSRKYADVLNKTLFYRQKADTVLADTNVTRLPQNSTFCEIDGLSTDYREIVAANPENTVAQQFYIAHILVTANKKRLSEYLEDNVGKPTHKRIQEACTIMFTTEECRQLGVNELVINDFEALKKGRGINDFYKTYWYYIAYLNKTLGQK